MGAGHRLCLDAVDWNAQELVAYRARCHSLTLFSRPEHRRCADEVATIALPDGRNGFAVTLDDNSIVTFTGPAAARHTMDGRTTLVVDQVNFVFHGEAEALLATGGCEADDPAIWRSSIKCEATTDQGRVAADVSSLGGPGERTYRTPLPEAGERPR